MANIVYPHFTARHFGVALYRSGNKLIIPPDALFFGRFMAMHPCDKESILGKWIEHRKKAAQNDLPCQYLFDLHDAYIIFDNETGKEHKANILELTANQLFHALKHKIAADEKHSTNLIDQGDVSVFQYGVPNFIAHTGGIVLSGKVLSKSSKQFRKVNIKGPFLQSAHRLGMVSCECESDHYNKMKESEDKGDSYSNLEVLCDHASALLFYASENPEKIQGYYTRRKGKDALDFFLPVNPGKFIRTEEFAGDDYAKDILLAEVILERYFNKAPRHTIASRLCNYDIFHPLIKKMLLNGKAGFEAVVQTQSPEMSIIAKNLFSNIIEDLQAKGFSRAGFVKAKIFTDYEETCANFINREGREVRVYSREDMPPVLVYCLPIEDNKEAPKLHFSTWGVPPPCQLYWKEERKQGLPYLIEQDPRTLVMKYVAVTLPEDLKDIPRKIIEDYRKMISLYSPDGIDGFKKRVEKKLKKPFFRQLFP